MVDFEGTTIHTTVGKQSDETTDGKPKDLCEGHKGERKTMCSPAMALVLAEMSKEDGANNCAVYLEECRTPTKEQMWQARMHSPASSDAGSKDVYRANAAQADESAGFWGTAWCCAQTLQGRMLTTLLDRMPWSHRYVRALEITALVPLIDDDCVSTLAYQHSAFQGICGSVWHSTSNSRSQTDSKATCRHNRSCEFVTR